ncbi:GNAT family N-acetyltransferase [Dietzia sp. E1]|uniref:GNAT family N-acetyltransferase n=1 Tax=Dietzia sp. E1 TaxID=328361 RepID=UPI0015F7895F|nr:GNAT family N-acetyltransferase [Dietzia sp. E1]MBB1020620.1 GNAT family N-acetyltransferase [Dietzia sp. E1]
MNSSTDGVVVRPATRFDDVAVLLGPRKDPDASVCWCLSHRVDSATNRSLVGRARGDRVRDLCAAEVAPGMLAYLGSEPVGWAAVAPRHHLPVARSRVIPTVDTRPVWSIFCIRVRPGYRGRGVAHDLVEGAVAFARAHGAPAVEAVPVDNGGEKVDLTMAFVGFRSLFEAAGFVKVADTSSVTAGFPRIVMRRELG